MTLALTSPAFADHTPIPSRFTCDGEDVSPPLEWSGVPHETKSLVLIVDDPDAPDPAAPRRVWVHWLLYNLPPDSHGLPQGAARGLPAEARQGVNDWRRPSYGGPCPAVGRHRYFCKLYALDTKLPDLHAPDKSRLEREMRGHILEQTELVGTYQRKR